MRAARRDLLRLAERPHGVVVPGIFPRPLAGGLYFADARVALAAERGLCLAAGLDDPTR